MRRSRASATAISCSTSPSFSRIVVRSACGNVGSIRASRSPFFTACPMRGSPASGAITRPPLMLCTRLVLFGSAITRPIRLTARCADCGASCSVRTSSSRWVGFGTKTCPSGSRRGESTASRYSRLRRCGVVAAMRRARSRTAARRRRPPSAPSPPPARNSAGAGSNRRTAPVPPSPPPAAPSARAARPATSARCAACRSWKRRTVAAS